MARQHLRQEHGAPAPARRSPPRATSQPTPRRNPALHRRESRPCRQARDRQGLRPEGRRPHRAEGPAARPAGRGPADQGAQAAGRAPAPCRQSACSTSIRPRRRRRTARRARPNGTTSSGDAPVVSIRAPRGGKGPTRRASATACWPRPSRPTSDGGPAYTGTGHQGPRASATDAALGVFAQARRRRLPHRAGRAPAARTDRRHATR